MVFVWQPSSSFQGWQRRVSVSITFRWVYSNLFVAEFRGDVRTTIPSIVECVKDSDSDVREAAIELLSRLAAQGVCWYLFPVGFLKRARSRISG